MAVNKISRRSIKFYVPVLLSNKDNSTTDTSICVCLIANFTLDVDFLN